MKTDSREYNILINAVNKIQNVDGFTCEIGVREGGSTQMILNTLKNTQQNKIHIAIDPFGNIDYEHWENRKEKLDYTNKMKNNMLKNLYTFCSENNMECLYFPLEDTEFFNRYSDGVPIYNENKYILNKYSLVFFDGPHTTK
jgi:undecaprenyl pyrophosphate synthase